MADQTPQTYANHGRFVPMYHYVALPLLTINLVWSIYRVTQIFTFESLNALGVSVSLVLVALFARVFALKAQDRVIRLEERLRMQTLLPDDLRPRIEELTTSQVIALRFASDAELPNLVRQALDQQADQKTIKQAIKNWRPDYQRV